MELKDDNPDGVDILLLYLYTLQVPTFADLVSAENALLIGDKYNVPALRDAGRVQFTKLATTAVSRFASIPKPRQVTCIAWIEKVYRWEIECAKAINIAIMAAVVKVSMSIIEHEKFRDFINRDEGFRWAFLRALSEKAGARPAILREPDRLFDDAEESD